MTMTRNGVIYDLSKSIYTVTYNNITFYFSSKNHLDKFNELLEENRYTLMYSLYKRFKLYVYANELFDLVLYKRVETRGFLVSIEGEFFKCLKNLKLDGVKRITKG